MKKFDIRSLTYGGLMTALVFVATAIIPRIPVPFTQGYIHTGDSMIFVTAILFGWKHGAIAGGLGSALADLYGYPQWAIPTLIIKGIMGALVGFVSHDLRKSNKSITAIINTVIIGIWLAFGVTIRNFFNDKLGNLANSELANKLITDMGLKGTKELSSLVSLVNNSLLVSIILIPVMAILVYIILRKGNKEAFSLSSIMGMTVAGLWMVIGYYIAGSFLLGNIVVPLFSIPANLLQFVGGAIIAFIVVIALRKTRYFKNFNN
ncbi:MAG: hypothetical protein FH751_09655 [Firmicutes bacterium]|nr:hypothetical protein [Bacillota bacterium]